MLSSFKLAHPAEPAQIARVLRLSGIRSKYRQITAITPDHEKDDLYLLLAFGLAIPIFLCKFLAKRAYSIFQCATFQPAGVNFTRRQ